MAEPDLVYFDIAAVVVMLVSLESFLIRRKTKTPANRVYLSAILLVTLTAVFGLASEVVGMLAPQAAHVSTADIEYPPIVRGGLQLMYYALRSLMAPTYLILIATISDTTHRLNANNLIRVLLWVPMVSVLVFVLTNPLHHLVFAYSGNSFVRTEGVATIYASTAYYSAIGIWWLLRWRRVLTDDEFATLMMLYPLVLLSVFVQYYFPYVHIEMFTSSVAIMMVSAFVMRSERQMDSLVAAASLQAYRDMCNRAFITQKPLCLVYLEIVNLERLREYVGKDEIQNIVSRVATNLSRSLEAGDVLYYLRNGLFCISSVNLDANHALAIATRTHEEGKARAKRLPAGTPGMEMRSCVVRIPHDVSDAKTLTSFVRRFSHLVPGSQVTSFEALSAHKNFALNMALSDCIEHAIHNRTFEVFYQPIFCLHDNHFHSAEALVRLKDPAFGWISPALFIPEAEQSGAILQIGSILLDKICAFLGTIDYQSTGLSYVEVNLSTEQCVRPQLTKEILGALEKHSVEAARVNLEITETSSTFSQDIVEKNVRALAAAGLTFSLDDYGSGYSNVTRMLSLPFDIVKFDKTFTDSLDNTQARTVFERSIAMLKQIGKQVLVEGVETPEQEEALRAMGADYLQGYLYSRPLRQDDFISFLNEHTASSPVSSVASAPSQPTDPQPA